MRQAGAKLLALVMVSAATGCESDTLFIEPDPPDAGFFADAAVPDAGLPMDAGFPDAGFEPAPEPVYVHTGDTLFSYDPDTHRVDQIGTFRSNSGPIEDMVDIAIDLDGRMFGGSRDQAVFLIDPTTAFCRYQFDFDDQLHGLTFLADGRLVVAGQRVSILDERTGQVEVELVGEGAFETSGDIVGLPDGFLYWTVRGASGDGLVRLDPRTGRTSMQGEASVDRIFGLGYAYGDLYGFTAAGEVVHLDEDSGRVLQHWAVEGRWWGATTNPVLWD